MYHNKFTHFFTRTHTVTLTKSHIHTHTQILSYLFTLMSKFLVHSNLINHLHRVIDFNKHCYCWIQNCFNIFWGIGNTTLKIWKKNLNLIKMRRIKNVWNDISIMINYEKNMEDNESYGQMSNCLRNRHFEIMVIWSNHCIT